MKCANHPLNDAVAYCGHCGRSLCADCKRDVSGMIYCEGCLAARLQTPARAWSDSGRGPSPGVALALGFIPGVGSIYNGQITKAVLQVLIFGSLLALSSRAQSPMDTIFGLGACAFYFYMVIDSFQTARAKSSGRPAPEWFGLEEFQMNVPMGAALLIALGVLFLLDNFGVPVISHLSAFWPVILIVAGVLLLQRRFSGGKIQPNVGSGPGQSTQIEKRPDGPNNVPGAKAH